MKTEQRRIKNKLVYICFGELETHDSTQDIPEKIN